jgi:DNA-binding MarR family transcriptional regulator
MNQHVKDIRLFNRFYTNIIGLIDQHILGSRYSLPEVRIMYEMYYSGATMANEIINLIHIDKGYLSRILLKFEKQKLISRKRSAKDARSVILALTTKGRREFQKLDLAAHDQIKEILSHLPKETHDELVLHMNAIKEILHFDTFSKYESNYL